MSETIHLRSIAIHDLGGIGEYRTKLSACNVIVGAHGVGKSSVLRVVEWIFEGGSDPSLIRLGSESGEATIAFSNGYTATKIQEQDGSKLIIKTPEGGVAKRPAELLKEWAPSLSFDPLGFLNVPEKEQVAFLLRTLPLNFSKDEVNYAVNEPLVVTDVNLQRLNEIRQGIYDERTTINRDADALRGTIDDFRKSLPKEEGRDWSAEVRRLTAEIGAKDTAIATAKSELELDGEKLKAETLAETLRGHDMNRTRIEALRKEIADIEAAIVQDEQTHLNYRARVDAQVLEQLAEETATLTQEKGALSIELGTAQANAEANQRAAGIREAITTRSATLKGHVSKEVRKTAQLKAIDNLKTEKLKALPVEGLDVNVDAKGKPVILINGIPLANLNQQQKIFVAVQLVATAQSKMQLILSEGAELNKGALTELTKALEAAGIQSLIARWDEDGPLRVVHQGSAVTV